MCLLHSRPALSVALIAALCSPLIAGPPATSVEQFLDEVQAIGEPDFDPARKHEPGYIERYKAEQHALYQRKAAKLLELCRAHPWDQRVPEWMNRRWVLLGWNQPPQAVADEILSDIETVTQGDIPAAARVHAAYWRALYLHHTAAAPAEIAWAATAFADANPADDRGAELLDLSAQSERLPPCARITLFERLAEQYPDTHYGKYAPGMLRRLQGIGKPVELQFRDELSGREISVAGLRGKVVVLDFWATTCGPCIEAMPKLKELYDRYAPEGVAFIGISLDEPEADGGRKSLRSFLKKHEIPWPQYYQGGGYDSPFSKSWGVGSAPTVFLLDKHGNLRTTEAHGDVENWIIRLLTE